MAGQTFLSGFLGVRREGPDRSRVGEGLEAEFTHEAGDLLAVDGEGLAPPPDPPVVGIPFCHAFAAPPAELGRRGTVGATGVQVPDQPGQDPVKESPIALPDRFGVCRIFGEFLLPAPVVPALVDLVVAAPEGQAGVAPQPDDLLPGFLGDVIQKCRVPRVHGTGKHEVLPDQDAPPVAGVKKGIWRIDAPAPDTQHVHAAGPGIPDQPDPAFRVSRQEAVRRHDIGPFGEKGTAVDLEKKGGAPGIGAGDELDPAHTRLLLDDLRRSVCFFQNQGQGSQGLGPHAGGPPE